MPPALQRVIQTPRVSLTVQMIVLIGTIAFVGFQVLRYKQETLAQRRANNIIVEAVSLSDDLSDLETGARGFALTGVEDYLVPYHRAVREIGPRIARIEAATIDHAPSRYLVQDIKANAVRKAAFVATYIDLRRQGDMDRVMGAIGTRFGSRLMRSAKADVDELIDYWRAEQDRISGVLEARHNLLGAGVLAALLAATIILLWNYRIHRRDERELTRTAEELRSLLGHMVEGVIKQDRSGRIIAANDAAPAILGLTTDQLMGRDSMDPRWGSITEDGKPLPASEHPSMVALRTGAPVVGCVMGILKPDGIRTWLYVNSMPLLTVGETVPDAVVSSFLDITELRQAHLARQESEARLQTIIDTVPAPIAYWGTDRTCKFSNEAMNAWCGSPGKSIRGRRAWNVWGPGVIAASAAHHRKAMEGEAVAFDRNDVGPDGSERHARVSYIPDRQDGETRGLFVLITDTTELTRRVEERTRQLRAARDKAEVANEAKDAFLANSSHEMRTPLHAIKGFTQLAAKRLCDVPDDKLSRYLANISSSADRLGTFVEDILTIAKLKAGQYKIDPKAVDLRSAVVSARESLAPLLLPKRLRFSIDESVQSCGVVADERMVEQVLHNVISNAIKFSKEDATIQVTLSETTLRLHPQAPAVPAVEIVVADEGSGIPEAELELIFERFQQSTRTSTGAGGTGLGLAICREIMRLHGGSIAARNRTFGGAEIRLVFPRALPNHGERIEALQSFISPFRGSQDSA